MTTAEKSRQSTAMISTQRLFTRLTEYGIVMLCNNSDDDDDDSIVITIITIHGIRYARRSVEKVVSIEQ